MVPAARQPARPLALSVVIDSRSGAGHASGVAELVGRLALQGSWLRQPWWPLAARTDGGADYASLLARLAVSSPVPAGLVVDTDAVDARWLDDIAVACSPERVGLPGAGPGGVRLALCGTPAAVADWQRSLSRCPGLNVTELAVPAAAVTNDAGPVMPAGRASRGAVLVPFSRDRDLGAAVRDAAMVAAGRPVLAEVTVSVGRTAGEARARAQADGLFTVVGHPAQQGLFGTLEECQATAARLAHAGATELVCYLPRASDLPDVLAQLRSIAIGASVLRPGEPPSAAPPPPAGWGGRRLST